MLMCVAGQPHRQSDSGTPQCKETLYFHWMQPSRPFLARANEYHILGSAGQPILAAPRAASKMLPSGYRMGSFDPLLYTGLSLSMGATTKLTSLPVATLSGRSKVTSYTPIRSWA